MITNNSSSSRWARRSTAATATEGPTACCACHSSSASAAAAAAPSKRRASHRPPSSLLPSFLPLLLALLALLALLSSSSPATLGVAAQRPPVGTGLGQANNVTSLRGTWSTGAGHVVTGLQFFNPANNSFTYPSTAGQSYSFTDDGHWEQALFIYKAHPEKPFCVSAQLIWQHGTYRLNSTNWLILTPFRGDGMQQISDRCGQQSQQVQPYNQQELMSGFEIHLDTHFGQSAYYLKMYEFDGKPKPLMWKVYDPPTMLPTQQLKAEVLNNAQSMIPT